MSSLDAKVDGVTVVVLGSFNPLIFQPAWFAAQGLIRQQESEGATVELIVNDIVSFSTEWLKVQVTRERFLTSTIQQNSYEPMRDLVAQAFRILTHVPVTGVGINYDSHSQLDSTDAWHKYGHRLAPKEPWAGVLDTPGLQSLAMKGKRPDSYQGYVLVRTEPSTKVTPNGIYISVNDHFDTLADEGKSSSEKLVQILEDAWSQSINRSRSLVQKLLETS